MLGLISFRQVLRDLMSQKLRTFLTTFGIVWGTAAVSLLLAFGEGLHRHQLKSIAGLGEYIVICWPSRTSLPFEGLPRGRYVPLTEDDMQLIRDRVPNLAGVSGEYSSAMMMNYGAKKFQIEVSGVSPVFGDLRNIIAQQGGRFINWPDDEQNRRSLFVGDELATQIFGSADPVGQTVLLAGSPFTVVGVMQTKSQDSSYSGRDNEKAFMPQSTMRALTGQRYVDNFIVKAASNEGTEALKNEMRSALAAKHRFDPKDQEVLSMWDTTENFQFFDTFMLGFKIFLGIVGVLTLIVGGIGVSNIMHVVVEERSKEIGIKMALGAKPGSILVHFLIETLLITAIGGAIGFAITIAISQIVALTPAAEFVGVPVISPLVAVGTTFLLGVIALLAGYFPARSASRLDPVIAMKL